MELVKLNQRNIWKIMGLKVKAEQEDFVATNAESIIEAFAVREEGYIALPFGLYEDGVPVGFVMIGYDSIGDENEPTVMKGNYCIWRLMIDEHHQGKGLGRKAMEATLDYIRTYPVGHAEFCCLSFEPENTAAESLYTSFGFRRNGEMDEDEVVAVRAL